MYLISSGECEYTFGEDVHAMASGSWLAEPVLWTHWVHRGDFVGKGDCRLCALNAKSFQKICYLFEHTGNFDPRDRAYEYCSALQQHANPSDLDAFGGAGPRKTQVSVPIITRGFTKSH